MQALAMGRPGHHCHDCGRTYLGKAEVAQVLCCDEEQGTRIENVCTVTRYYCKDPRGACSLDEDEITEYDEVWQCGNCDEYHGNVADAISCCK